MESKGSDTTLIHAMPKYGFISAETGQIGVKEKELKYPLPFGFGEHSTASIIGSPIATLNCAACHTGSINVDGQLYLIEGSANMVNTAAWGLHVNDSITATSKSTSKIIATIIRWMRSKPHKSLPEKYTPRADTHQLEDINKYVIELENGQRKDTSIPKSTNGTMSDMQKEDIVAKSNNYVIAQTLINGLNLTDEQQTIEEAEKQYKDNVEKEIILLKDKLQFEGAFQGRFKPKEFKSSGIKSTQEFIDDTWSKVRKMKALLEGLTKMREHGLDVITKSEDNQPSGPGRDDAWYTLSRMVGEVSHENMKPGAPVKIPNLFSYAYYSKKKQEENKTYAPYLFHCDGNTSSIQHRNMLQGFALGALPPKAHFTIEEFNDVKEMYVDHKALLAAEDYYKKIKIPNFKTHLSSYLNTSKAEYGKKIFHNSPAGGGFTCADCHDGGKMPAGKLIDHSIVGTDTSRLNVFKSNQGDHNFEKLKLKLHSDIVNYYRLTNEKLPNDPPRIPNDPNHEIWKGYTQGYMARPLNGVWASPPYLHNGSVRTLWDLLKKPEDREPSFWKGTRNYDPHDVGYKCEKLYSPLNNGKVIEAYKQDNSNGQNKGHNFGTEWEDEDKRAVIEYIKTLGEPE